MDEETRALSGLKSICTYCEQISYAIRRFRHKELNRAAESIMQRKESILAWYDNPISNGYAEEINSMIQTTKQIAFELGEKRFSLHTVETDNFKQIFDDISMIVPSTTSSQVRRFRQLVKNLVITSNPNQQQLLYIGAVDFDDKDLKDVVLIVADNTQMTRVLSEFTSCDALVRDVLFNNISMDSNTVLTAFENKKLFKNTEYVPTLISQYTTFNIEMKIRNLDNTEIHYDFEMSSR